MDVKKLDATLTVLLDTFRSTVRPVSTYALLALAGYLIFNGIEVPQMLANLNYITAGFWFGERAFVNLKRAGQLAGGLNENK